MSDVKDLSVEMVSTEVVEFKAETILQAIEKGGELDFLTEQLRKKVASFEHDMSTGVSRNRSASLSRKISTAKTKVVKFAKATIEDDEIKIKKVKASLKKLSSDFDELRDTARLPLTEWEAEDKRLKAVEAARLESEKLLNEFNNDHEMGLLLDEKYDRDEAEKARIEKELTEKEAIRAAIADKDLAAKQEAERVERDARIAQEAASKAIAEVRAKVERERVEREKSEEAQKRQIEQAQRDKIAAEERAKVQEEEAEKRRVEAAEKAKRDAIHAAENARLAEIKRQEDEAVEIKAAYKRRAEDKLRVGEIRKNAKEAIMREAACDEHTAKKFIIAVHAGLIPNVSIKY